VTSLRVGVDVATVVLRKALYLKYRPLKKAPEREVGLVVKNVPLVPSGPMKVKGPTALPLAAAWNLTVVLGGVVAVHDREVQCGAPPGAGLASLIEDTRSPETPNTTGVVM